jgi:hypothetical protein
MADQIVEVKEAIRDFVVNNICETGNDFSQYFTTPNAQIYWEWSKQSVRDDFPYIYMEIEADNTTGYSSFNSYEVRTVNTVKKIYKIEKAFNVFTVAFNFCVLSNFTAEVRSLDAQNMAAMMARLIRRKLKSDDSTTWFAMASNDDAINIGVESKNISDIMYLPDYEDTKTNHKYRFTCSFNWHETYEQEIRLATGAKITKVNEETVNMTITP